MSNIVIISDNNNFAPSVFRSLCEFVGDCFGPRYFSLGATFPQKYTSVQNIHLRFHTITSKKMVRSYYCLIENKRKNADRQQLQEGPHLDGVNVRTPFQGYMNPRGATQMARWGIRLVHGLTKSTLNIYFPD